MTIYNLRMKNKKTTIINPPSAMEHNFNKKNMTKKLFFVLAMGLLITKAGAQTNSFPSSGNAGIGTTSPAAPLEINTTLNAGDPVFQFGNAQQNGQIIFRDRDIASFLFGVQANQIKIGAQGNEHKIMSIQYNAQNIELWPTVAINSPSNILINAGQNVGIGSTNPQYKLDVNGVINATGININGTSIGSISSIWSSGSNGIYYNSGNVGIGTTTPNAPLEIGVTRNAGDAIFQFGNPQQNGQIIFRDRDVASFIFGVQASQVKIGAQGNEHKIMSIQSNAQNFELWPTVAINSPNNILINAGQNVGIGTTSPQSKLDINGTAHVAGTASFDSDLALGGNLSVTGTLQSSGSLSASCVSTACLNVSGTFSTDNLKVNHNASADTLISGRVKGTNGSVHFGDASIVVDYVNMQLYNDGVNPSAGGFTAILPHGVGIGQYANAWSDNSVVIGGTQTKPLSNGAAGTSPFTNSLMVGFNTVGPTLFVGPGDGSANSGNVGIGTTTPSAKFNVVAPHGIPVSTVSEIECPGGSLFCSARYPVFTVNSLDASGNVTNTRFTVNHDGFVGVGTDNPLASLQVNGSISVDAYNSGKAGNFDGNVSLLFGQESAPAGIGKWGIQYVPVGPKAGSLSSTSQGGLNFWVPFDPDDINYVGNAYLFIADGIQKTNVNMPDGSGGVTQSTVTTNGYVGIGTADPSYKLDVAGVVNAQNYFQNGQPLKSSQWANYSCGTNSTDDIFYYTGTNGSGKVSIGFPCSEPLPSSALAAGDPTKDYHLYVKGGILTEHVRVAIDNSANWKDNVFAPDYKLKSISDLKEFINKNHHLPNIPSAEEVVKDGIDVGEMNAKLLGKVEELTLYIIEMKNQLNAMNAEMTKLKEDKASTH